MHCKHTFPIFVSFYMNKGHISCRCLRISVSKPAVAIICEQNIHAPHVEIIVLNFRTFDNLTEVRRIHRFPSCCKAAHCHGFQGFFLNTCFP